MHDEVLSFEKNNLLSELRTDESNIIIAIGQDPAKTGVNNKWLYGACQIEQEYANELKVQPIQRAIVITWTANGEHKTKNLVGTKFVFSDDEIVIDNMCVGYFNCLLNDWFPEYQPNEFFITASIGCYLSNTLRVKLR